MTSKLLTSNVQSQLVRYWKDAVSVKITMDKSRFDVQPFKMELQAMILF